METMGRIDEQIQVLRSREHGRNEPGGTAESTLISNIGSVGQSQIIRVETARPPQIGTFNGNSADWPAFRDLFLAEVHQKDLDAVTKLLYLQQACIDKAAATLG